MRRLGQHYPARHGRIYWLLHDGVSQETLAKLHLRDGVNRQLWGLQLAGPTNPGAEITSELAKVCEGGGL